MHPVDGLLFNRFLLFTLLSSSQGNVLSSRCSVANGALQCVESLLLLPRVNSSPAQKATIGGTYKANCNNPEPLHASNASYHPQFSPTSL